MSGLQAPAPDSPSIPPPPGVTPCFDDPFTLKPYHSLTVAAAAISTTVLLAARLYTKQFLLRRINLEDISCTLGWAFFIVDVGIQERTALRGAGTHQWNLQYQQVQYLKQWNNYGDMTYSMALLFTKLSIMLLIKRVFCSVKRDVAYWLTIFLMFANTAFYICFLVVPAAQCLPRTKIWNPEEPGTCVDIYKLYNASAIFNLVSDVAMLSVPIYLVWRLQMSLRRKIGVSAIFCTGTLACVASTARLVYNIRLTNTTDYSFTHTQSTMFAIAEIAFGLLCSCLIVLPRLYQHFCDITPYTAHDAGSHNGTDPRSRVSSHGKSKREWVQLERHAETDRRKFGKEARLGDEVAIDNAVDDVEPEGLGR